MFCFSFCCSSEKSQAIICFEMTLICTFSKLCP
ncbi:hypothetical protein PHET_11058 [Paragonimus heterotremus]|uniref:Uncharacterized protein n=1 Tax=Paragonimus heterotremus TaxID=100268 RepID=A0A8J4WDR0_9TREM|nr:hypothetical protein PHET_11058 [Paragonimus heterotremus]